MVAAAGGCWAAIQLYQVIIIIVIIIIIIIVIIVIIVIIIIIIIFVITVIVIMNIMMTHLPSGGLDSYAGSRPRPPCPIYLPQVFYSSRFKSLSTSLT